MCDIDPDNHYLNDTSNTIINKYFDINTFNNTFSTKDEFTIFLLNMRSLPEHFRELTTYLDCLNTKFKVIALTETWLKEWHTSYTIPNYNFEQEFRHKMRGGGVALYLHNSLQYTLRDDLKLTKLLKN